MVNDSEHQPVQAHDMVVVAEWDELERLRAAATPGPWRECGHERGGCSCAQVWSILADGCVAIASKYDATEGEGFKPEQAVNNAAYIAYTNPERIGRLLAERSGIKEALATAMGVIKEVTGDVKDAEARAEAAEAELALTKRAISNAVSDLNLQLKWPESTAVQEFLDVAAQELADENPPTAAAKESL